MLSDAFEIVEEVVVELDVVLLEVEVELVLNVVVVEVVLNVVMVVVDVVPGSGETRI
jgi:hypothetical protein